MKKVCKFWSILTLLSFFAATSMFGEASKVEPTQKVKSESEKKVESKEKVKPKKELEPKLQSPTFPEGFALAPAKYYEDEKFPEGYYYTAKELVHLPTSEYQEKYFIGEVEITKQINKHVYTVQPVTGIFEDIKDWFDGLFIDDELIFGKPIIYLSIPADAPDITGKDFTFTKNNPVDIMSIKNMTDEETDIKGDKKKIPEYTIYLKYEGHLQVDDKFYPEKPKPVKAEKKAEPDKTEVKPEALKKTA
ncbi:MAG TPA: hypothetical protein QF753_22430 [Victivallales bacterium]|nr:hypothetical protein [Victivallales bacterium]